MNTQTVTINLVPGLSTPPVVNVKQGDIGRPLAFKVLDGTSSAMFAGATVAKVEGTKPSGLGFSETGTITGNTVTLNTTEEMTQENGRILAEISFTNSGTVIGTANFILAVERDPHPENVIDGTYETMDDIQTQVNGLDTRVTALEEGGGSGLTDDIKTALLQIAQKVAYIDANGQDYYDDLYDALYSSSSRSVLLVLSHVSSSNTQSTVEVGDSYTTTLTASTNYTINSVTVTMGGVDVTSTTYSSGTVSIPSVTGNIVITATAVLAAQSITATYTQSGTVYDTDSLNSLKADLVVTANYSGGGSDTVPSSDYTLSGTLTAGTSTITVTYAGLTTTFNVTVTHEEAYVTSGLMHHWDGINNTGNGHDTTTDTWSDLVGNLDMTPYNTGSHNWTSNGYTFTRSGSASTNWLQNSNTSLAPDYTDMTIEMVFVPTAAISTPVIAFNNASRKLCLYSDNTVNGTGVASACYPTGLTAITDMKSMAVVYSSSGIVKVKVNNSTLTNNGANHSFKDNFGIVWGSNTRNSGSYGSEGTLYAVRVYNRQLTDAELTTNYNVDISRFSLS